MPQAAPWRAPTPRRRSAASSPETPEDWRSHLGRKVSIRYRLHGDPAHPFSEAIGVVQVVRDEADVQQIEVLNRKGDVVKIATSDILAAKLFPID